MAKFMYVIYLYTFQTAECDLEIKEETLETSKEEEETEVRESYDTVASDMSEVHITDDMDDPADLMMMKLDQTTSGNQPADLHPHNTQESYPPALTATLPGPSDMQRVSCVYIVQYSRSTGKATACA